MKNNNNNNNNNDNIKKKYRKKNFFASKPEGKFRSQLEKKIYEKIKSYDNQLEILVNEKKVAAAGFKKKFELDLYFPNLKLCVEIQGPTHTSSPKNIYRDYLKKISCEKEGIEIAYIYGDEKDNVNKLLNIIENKKKIKNK